MRCAADWPVHSVFRTFQPAAGRPASPWAKPEMFWTRIAHDNGVDGPQYLVAEPCDWLPFASATCLCFELLQAIEETRVDTHGRERLSGWRFGVIWKTAEKEAQSGGLEA